MKSDLAGRFESLGGGRLQSGVWGFGCEVGFWQRHHGKEPLDFLRWVSISPDDLMRGLKTRFETLDDPATYKMRRAHHPEWEYTQHDYGFKVDHSGIPVDQVDAATAATKIAAFQGFMRTKFFEGLEESRKPLVYRLRDDRLNIKQIEHLANVLSGLTRRPLVFAQLATGAEEVHRGGWLG